jgi:hypothetical protein
VTVRAAGIALAAGLAVHAGAPGDAPRIEVVVSKPERRVEVRVDGRAFTAWIWPESLSKPTLYPVLDARGEPLTRGFPLEPREGERTDHPHHVGLWLNHGDVNGVDFWNNSPARPDAARMGRVVHRAVDLARSGAGEGELAVSADWLLPGDVRVLAESTRLVFRASGAERSIDRVTRLTAQDREVVFRDNKEGFLGMRVARGLEAPEGKYLSSEGLAGDAVWGTRGRWAALTGTIAGETVTLAILDHPENPGHPATWHARGYGLFAANPLGPAAYGQGRTAFDLRLTPGASATFRFRVLVLPGAAVPDVLEARFREFATPSR